MQCGDMPLRKHRTSVDFMWCHYQMRVKCRIYNIRLCANNILNLKFVYFSKQHFNSKTISKIVKQVTLSFSQLLEKIRIFESDWRWSKYWFQETNFINKNTNQRKEDFKLSIILAIFELSTISMTWFMQNCK